MVSKNRVGPLFSIVVPAYNAATYVGFSLDSVFAQTVAVDLFEVILVDDCSTDNTEKILAPYFERPNFRLAKTPRNAGPGAARNVGVDLSIGQWIIFLDSDDRLMPDALLELQKEIEMANAAGAEFDAIGFDWSYIRSSDDSDVPANGLRRDHIYLNAGRDILLQRYLSLQMDGSVIYTTVRRSLLLDRKIRFDNGIHEDIDYLFYIYWYANSVRFVNRILYGKVQRRNSIVNTITEKHLVGFFRAWYAIGLFLAENEGGERETLQAYFRKGLTAVVATRLREICRSADGGAAIALYRYLHNQAGALQSDLGLSPDLTLYTKYGMLARSFFEIMTENGCFDEQKAERVTKVVRSVLKKSWSCIDLHHSVFLGPNEIRTCCKRFFRDGEMRGDVVLISEIAEQNKKLCSDDIIAAKLDLYRAVNMGEPTGCSGCPFLEFKEWPTLDNLDIRYLSLEYHSVCNLQCSYCSDTYYGGVKASYDIPTLVDEFVERGQLANCNTVVWGGGEPVVDVNFAPLIEKLVASVPRATHRILTNSVKFSKIVAKLLAENRISITTSIDAGSASTFKIVRGRDRFRSVMSNLKQYAALQSGKLTIKYIFTQENSNLDEVRNFVDLVSKNGLNGCSIQISSNFKEEMISIDSAVLMIAMYGLLIQAGFKVIFFDDLLRHRLTDIHAELDGEIRRRLKKIGLESAIACHQNYPEVAVWGAGWQAKYLVKKSVFFKYSKIAFFVDDTPSKIGTRYLGHEVFSPSMLLENDLPVMIAAVQGYPFIYDALLHLGIATSRLVTGLVF